MVTDFGIARLAVDAEASLPGTTLGSVHYFSPEQARGRTTTPPRTSTAWGSSVRGLTGRRAWTRRHDRGHRPGPRRRRAVPARRRPERARRRWRPSSRRPSPPIRCALPTAAPWRPRLEPLVGRRTGEPDASGIPAATWPPLCRGSLEAGSSARRSVALAAPLAAGALAPPRSSARSRRAAPVIAGPCSARRRRRGPRRRSVVAALPGARWAVALPHRGRPTPHPTADRHAPSPGPTAKPDARRRQATPSPEADHRPPTRRRGARPVRPVLRVRVRSRRGPTRPSRFEPAFDFKLGGGWSTRAQAARSARLRRDEGRLTFVGRHGHSLPGGKATNAPRSARSSRPWRSSTRWRGRQQAGGVRIDGHRRLDRPRRPGRSGGSVRHERRARSTSSRAGRPGSSSSTSAAARSSSSSSPTRHSTLRSILPEPRTTLRHPLPLRDRSRAVPRGSLGGHAASSPTVT